MGSADRAVAWSLEFAASGDGPVVRRKANSGRQSMVALAKLNESMNRPTSLDRRIEDLEAAAQKTRLEAMRMAALILTRLNGVLPAMRDGVTKAEELVTLQGRHAGLMQKAEDLQTKIDLLRADKYDQERGIN